MIEMTALIWYAVLCFVIMPLDRMIAKSGNLFVPPAATVLYLMASIRLLGFVGEDNLAELRLAILMSNEWMKSLPGWALLFVLVVSLSPLLVNLRK